MVKKILLFMVFLFTAITLLPIAAPFATKPVDVTAVLYLEAWIVEEKIAGNNWITKRYLEGFFTGDFAGAVERHSTIVSNQLSKSPHGPIFPAFVAAAQELMTVTDSTVNVDSISAEGSFVIGAWSHPSNLKWTILSSDLMIEGEPAKMHGQGSMIITEFTQLGGGDDPDYSILVTLHGQIGFLMN